MRVHLRKKETDTEKRAVNAFKGADIHNILYILNILTIRNNYSQRSNKISNNLTSIKYNFILVILFQ